jgi:hypothetical protein
MEDYGGRSLNFKEIKQGWNRRCKMALTVITCKHYEVRRVKADTRSRCGTGANGRRLLRCWNYCQRNNVSSSLAFAVRVQKISRNSCTACQVCLSMMFGGQQRGTPRLMHPDTSRYLAEVSCPYPATSAQADIRTCKRWYSRLQNRFPPLALKNNSEHGPYQPILALRVARER